MEARDPFGRGTKLRRLRTRIRASECAAGDSVFLRGGIRCFRSDSDASGVPRRSEVMSGKGGEANTPAAAIRRSGRHQAHGGDGRGHRLENILRWRLARGYPWTTASPSGAPRPAQSSAAAFVTRVGDLDKVWRLETEEGETHPCVRSAERQRRDDAFLTRRREAYEEALRSVHERLSKRKQKQVRRFDQAPEQLRQVRERHARVNRNFDIFVEPGEMGRGRRGLLAPQRLLRAAMPRPAPACCEPATRHGTSRLSFVRTVASGIWTSFGHDASYQLIRTRAFDGCRVPRRRVGAKGFAAGSVTRAAAATRSRSL